jgi:hypothetical protein
MGLGDLAIGLLYMFGLPKEMRPIALRLVMRSVYVVDCSGHVLMLGRLMVGMEHIPTLP